MARDYYWPHMTKHIEWFCGGCGVCQRTKYSRDKKQGFLCPLPIPQRRWQYLSVDYIISLPVCNCGGTKYQYLAVVCDHLTKRHHFFPTETLGSQELARIFLPIFAQHGLPESIVSDRGANFVSRFWQRLCKRLGITQKLLTAFHPETDG